MRTKTPREFGACCALRNHVPLVVTGPADTERFPWSEAAVICTPDELAGTVERLTRPADEALRRDAERVALHVRGLSDRIARAETAGMVREAVRGRRDLDEAVTAVMVPEED